MFACHLQFTYPLHGVLPVGRIVNSHRLRHHLPNPTVDCNDIEPYLSAIRKRWLFAAQTKPIILTTA